MSQEGRRPGPGELPHYNFMTRRINAFERNEVDPENLKRIVNDLISKKTTMWGWWYLDYEIKE